jgi:hypothetical protein
MMKRIRITFEEEILGTASNSQDIHREFIAANAPDAQSREEEVAAIGVDAAVEKSMTVFPRHEGKPFLWDYQLKGFFKDACSMLSRMDETESKKLKAFKKIIDGFVFVKPRMMMLNLPAGTAIGSCQRPLRAQTAQGERIALANSETCPAGTTVDAEIHVFQSHLPAVLEWLNYGALRGIGQWRNSGKGRFTWKDI